MSNLTERQSQVLDLIRRYIEDTGYPPTRADIARELGFRSANAAEEHLRALARKGAIEMTAGASRGIRLSGESGIPVVGRVAAGSPLLAAEHIEQHVQVPARLFSPAAEMRAFSTATCSRCTVPWRPAKGRSWWRASMTRSR